MKKCVRADKKIVLRRSLPILSDVRTGAGKKCSTLAVCSHLEKIQIIYLFKRGIFFIFGGNETFLFVKIEI